MSLEFDVYKVTQMGDNAPKLSQNNRVESGLSGGELRQSILDRLREQFKEADYHKLNMNLRLVRAQITRKDSFETAMKKIETALYDTSDDHITDTYWIFKNEIIYVLGLEE